MLRAHASTTANTGSRVGHAEGRPSRRPSSLHRPLSVQCACLTSFRPCRPCRHRPFWVARRLASVMRMFFAIEAAFCSAERVTIVGSMMPALTRVFDLVRVDVRRPARCRASVPSDSRPRAHSSKPSRTIACASSAVVAVARDVVPSRSRPRARAARPGSQRRPRPRSHGRS